MCLALATKGLRIEANFTRFSFSSTASSWKTWSHVSMALRNPVSRHDWSAERKETCPGRVRTKANTNALTFRRGSRLGHKIGFLKCDPALWSRAVSSPKLRGNGNVSQNFCEQSFALKQLRNHPISRSSRVYGETRAECSPKPFANW